MFGRHGVDYRQWKAVSRTAIRADFTPVFSSGNESYSMRTAWGLLMMAAVYGLFGAGAALLVVLNPDLRLTGTVTLTYLSFVLATGMLAHHGATMLAPADVAILGPRPVSAATFFAVRLTTVLFHTAVVTTLTAAPPVLAFTFAHGVSVARGIGAAIAVYTWAVALTLALVVAYTLLLRVAGAARLRRAVGYLQMVTGLLAYGGFLLVMQSIGAAGLESARFPETRWLAIFPPVWFVSFLEIATGQVNAGTLLRAALSLGTIAAVGLVLRERFLREYQHLLSAGLESEANETAAPGAARRTPLFGRGEARAVALLVRAHFRHDLRVRMGILALVPLLIFYVALGVRGGPSTPFAPEAAGSLDPAAIAVLLFPAILTRHFASSDSHRAAWIYGVTIARREDLVRALRNVAVLYFMVPFLFLLVLLFAWQFRHAGQALVHATVLGLVGHVALQIAFIVTPRLPFAHPPEKVTGNAALFAWMGAVIFGGQLLVFALQRWIYVAPARTVACIALIGAVSCLLEFALRARARAVIPS